ncbi:DUF3826 domain-containing protein [Pontibacter qinzhouensis]|uniref:DUF3826 domain-containing protein n=2 Tax=Pontibacter qinzhouensis TaxID=2603253 RepID=A0A5C8IRC4_9BACT|nr:DUF3826 domain-containing protein [Pontibacter qinzhouensis]TXK23455.1 DUF3826 domain-containing protein [Pontibacter qinzhouensis]
MPSVAQKAKKSAKEEAQAYIQVTNQRADKIVDNMAISDRTKKLKVRDYVAQQYRDLSRIHEQRDARVKAVKETAGTNKQATEKRIAEIDEFTNAELAKLHQTFIGNLQAQLSAEQVDQVKDGMTYGVVPITYKGYLAMLPNLTEEQKTQIMAWLVEAREHAMDAGTSEKKHGWFGKYKGRINNYLSAAGYDLKKAGDEWVAREKAEQEPNSKK